MAKKRPTPAVQLELTPAQKRPGQILEAVLDTVRDSGFLVVDLQSPIDPDKIPEEHSKLLLGAIDFNALSAALLDRKDEFSDLAGYLCDLKPKEDDLRQVSDDLGLNTFPELDLEHPVVLHATIAATSDNAFEIGRALADLRRCLADIGIRSRAQLELRMRNV